MTSLTQPAGAATQAKPPTQFNVTTSKTAATMTKPQLMASRLWLPMFAMAVMGLVVGLILAAVRAGVIGDGNPADVDTIETLRHLVPGFLFLGFSGVFAAVSFAIARILGIFRVGGGEVQDDIGRGVQSLKMPLTGKAFIGLMMMGMMAVAAGALVHIVVGLSVPSAAEAGDISLRTAGSYSPRASAAQRGFRIWRDPQTSWHTYRPDGTEIP